MKNTIIFLFIILTIHTQAQKESWHWYFGENAGIDFSSGIPVLTNGSLHTYEGCAAISDSSGSLLFYTDGRFVYNRVDSQMSNGYGLMGDTSSTQSSLIVPLPGSDSLYYIFTVDYNQNGLANGNGFQYSIVDMSLNNGLGDVITKNVLVRLPVYEKLTAIKHSNNSDYWILINDWQTDAIFAYLLTSSGLIVSPIVSFIGPFHMGNYSNTGGYFKASSQGNKIALALWAKNSFDICDFNSTTGIASNHITIQSNDMISTYGIEFSPNGKYLYGTNMEPPCHLYQFDLTSGTPSGILNSRITLDSNITLYYYDALQLAPDGKIYCAHRNEYFLGVIQNPDSGGILCNYTDSGFSTGTHLSKLGLPNFPSEFFNNILPHANIQSSDSNLCPEQCINFSDLSTNNPTSWHWYFPGGTPSSSTVQNPTGICYVLPGTYDVSLVVINSYGSDSIVFTGFITVYPVTPIPVITDINDTLHCNNSSGYISFQWYLNTILITGATDSIYHALLAGDYSVEAFDVNGCSSIGKLKVATGIAFLPGVNTITLQPNPAHGELTIHATTVHENELISLYIWNVLGETVFFETFKWTGEKIIRIDELPPGLYALGLKSNANFSIYTNSLFIIR